MDFEFIAGHLALDFTNTVHNHGMPDPEDDLKTASDFKRWALQAGLLRDAEVRRLRTVDPVRFRRTLALREALYAIFSRVAHGKNPPSQALLEFQGFYQNAMQHAEFHRRPDRYQLEWPAATDPFDRILHDVARSAAELLTSDALARVRQCSGDDCSWLFVDRSRNGMKRWCDMKACGNRAKVRRFRRQLSQK